MLSRICPRFFLLCLLSFITFNWLNVVNLFRFLVGNRNVLNFVIVYVATLNIVQSRNNHFYLSLGLTWLNSGEFLLLHVLILHYLSICPNLSYYYLFLYLLNQFRFYLRFTMFTFSVLEFDLRMFSLRNISSVEKERAKRTNKLKLLRAQTNFKYSITIKNLQLQKTGPF